MEPLAASTDNVIFQSRRFLSESSVRLSVGPVIQSDAQQHPITRVIQHDKLINLVDKRL